MTHFYRVVSLCTVVLGSILLLKLIRMSLNRCQVVIVGAGVAGLSAASRLAKKGFRDIVVLEAGNRTGGRMHTATLGNRPIELGAQWVHGEEDNTMFDFCKDRRLIHEVNPDLTFYEAAFCTENGDRIDREIVEQFMDCMAMVEESVRGEDVPDVLPHWKEITVSHYYHEEADKLLEVHGLALDASLKEGLMNWQFQFQCSIEGCDSLDEMSVASYTPYKTCQGNPLINLKYGYKAVLESLANDLPQDCIKFNWPVKNVTVKPDGTLTVTSNDGRTIQANHVIVTPSIGYLKKHYATLFTPPLPQHKVDAIKEIGFGTVNKIFIEFDRPFWNDSPIGYSFIRRTNKEEYWTDGVFGFYSVFDRPSVLCGWVTGHCARQMEQLTDTQIQEDCLRLLKQFTGMNELPAVIGIYPSRWDSNPYVLGSYSFQTKSSFKLNKAVERLGEPIYYRKSTKRKIPVLMFAGEATHPHYFSTVHGAMETGFREALRVISCYNGIPPISAKL